MNKRANKTHLVKTTGIMARRILGAGGAMRPCHPARAAADYGALPHVSSPPQPLFTAGFHTL